MASLSANRDVNIPGGNVAGHDISHTTNLADGFAPIIALVQNVGEALRKSTDAAHEERKRFDALLEAQRAAIEELRRNIFALSVIVAANITISIILLFQLVAVMQK